MGKTVTDILTIVSGASWTLFYLLVIFLSYRDKDLRHAVLGIGIQFQLGADLFVCVEHSFFRPAIATYHQQNMAVFDLFIFIAYFLYGKRERPSHLSRSLFYPYSTLVLI